MVDPASFPVGAGGVVPVRFSVGAARIVLASPTKRGGGVILASSWAGAGGVVLVSFSVGAGRILPASSYAGVLVPSADPSSARTIQSPPILLPSISFSLPLVDGVGSGRILI